MKRARRSELRKLAIRECAEILEAVRIMRAIFRRDS